MGRPIASGVDRLRAAAIVMIALVAVLGESAFEPHFGFSNSGATKAEGNRLKDQFMSGPKVRGERARGAGARGRGAGGEPVRRRVDGVEWKHAAQLTGPYGKGEEHTRQADEYIHSILKHRHGEYRVSEDKMSEWAKVAAAAHDGSKLQGRGRRKENLTPQQKLVVEKAWQGTVEDFSSAMGADKAYREVPDNVLQRPFHAKTNKWRAEQAVQKFEQLAEIAPKNKAGYFKTLATLGKAGVDYETVHTPILERKKGQRGHVHPDAHAEQMLALERIPQSKRGFFKHQNYALSHPERVDEWHKNNDRAANKEWDYRNDKARSKGWDNIPGGRGDHHYFRQPAKKASSVAPEELERQEKAEAARRAWAHAEHRREVNLPEGAEPSRASHEAARHKKKEAASLGDDDRRPFKWVGGKGPNDDDEPEMMDSSELMSAEEVERSGEDGEGGEGDGEEGGEGERRRRARRSSSRRLLLAGRRGGGWGGGGDQAMADA